ncbi:MAG: thiamine-phosphate pyrophosphorylase [Elusimicrobia bacterium]|nr:thiamine-phosphate pyrophosphorylase [Elusimicrobiota bacterium]
MQAKKLTIIDANFNRAREGLRVVEDLERFFFKKNRFLKIRRLRHELSRIFENDYEKLVKSRNVQKDEGRKLKEKPRKTLREVFIANIFRTGEALRVLEEILKKDEPDKAGKIKKIRFKLYTIEKEFVKDGIYEKN